MSSSVVPMFQIICVIQLGALFALVLVHSYSSVRRSLLATTFSAAARGETEVLPLERPAENASGPRYRVAS